MRRKPRCLMAIMLLMAMLSWGVTYAFEWTYEKHGENWGGLCQKGKRQSPIDIKTAFYNNVIKDENASIKDRLTKSPMKTVRAIHINGDEGYFTYGKERYEAFEFHFHSPSEHTVNGKHLPLEMHILHKDKQNNYAVLAVLFEKSEKGGHLLADLDWKQCSKSGRFKHLHRPMGLAFLNEASHYIVYNGSFTTPPCTEGVKWFLLTRHFSISNDDLKRWKRFDNAFKGKSYRYTQPLNHRVLKRF